MQLQISISLLFSLSPGVELFKMLNYSFLYFYEVQFNFIILTAIVMARKRQLLFGLYSIELLKEDTRIK